MTTVNTIENKILEMSGGEFQKLCDAYLSAIGYGKPNTIGSVAGADKVRKGTPDTYFVRKNGKFVFAEYTTQITGNLFSKLKGDLKNCLDEDKTGVPVSEIEEIVLCYSGLLEPDDFLALETKRQGKKLTQISLSALAFDLINHPLLVSKFLNLHLDTGQIIPLEDFPSIYGKSKFATTLETNFHFREKELDDFSNALEANDLVVVSGKPGVGKTRFTLEGCRNFVATHSEYQAYSIVSISQSFLKICRNVCQDQDHFLFLWMMLIALIVFLILCIFCATKKTIRILKLLLPFVIMLSTRLKMI